MVRRMAEHLLAPGCRVLTPFSGSGSEVIALLLAGAGHVEAVEREPQYVEIAGARLKHWIKRHD